MFPRRRPHGLRRQPLGGRTIRPRCNRPCRLPRRPAHLQDAGGAGVLRWTVAAAAAQRGGGRQADVAAQHDFPELHRSLSGHMTLLVLERSKLAVLLRTIIKNEQFNMPNCNGRLVLFT